jgi:hypothetical protein
MKHVNHCIDFGEHLSIREAQNADAAGFEQLRALGVVLQCLAA